MTDSSRSPEPTNDETSSITPRLERTRRDVALDLTLVWVITVLAYLAVGVLRGHQLVRSAWSRLRPERDLLE